MVKAMLSYNPYLLETKIEFNGQIPKVNSLVEKYQNKRLQDWIEELPMIFYDEMNGYDFDLYFSGTRTDMNELELSFERLGISTQTIKDDILNKEIADVRLLLINQLESSLTKNKEVEDLLCWLHDRKNRKFDNQKFRNENSILFDDPITYITVLYPNINNDKLQNFRLSIENVVHINEFPSDLLNTPILLYVDEKNKKQFFEILEYLYSREDVRQEQLFFMISPSLVFSKIKREIQDKGIEPQLVSSFDDKKIVNFLEIYPITNFISSSIKTFRREYYKLYSILENENELARMKNIDIHREIDTLEDEIKKIKKSREEFNRIEKKEFENRFIEIENKLYGRVKNWKKRKTKYTSDYDAEKGSKELVEDLNKYFKDFLQSVSVIFSEENENIYSCFGDIYRLSESKDGFDPTISSKFDIDKYNISHDNCLFMSSREVVWAEQSEPIIGLAKKILGDINTATQLVEVITYSIDNWRDIALNIVTPLCNDILNDFKREIDRYYSVLSTKYKDHLDHLILEKNKVKESILGTLSEGERNLQEDNNWLLKFDEQLRIIERG